MFLRLLALIGLAVLGWAAAPALAADVGSIPDGFFIHEFRLGAFVHDPSGPESGGGDINLELLLAKPWGTAAEWWLPRPHVGATVNIDGGTSTAYVGATWQFDLGTSLFVEGSIGPSIHDADGRTAAALGCPVLIRSAASLGYRLSGHWQVMATVEHNSNAGLCDRNRGLTNAGVRLGYRF